MFEKSLYDLIRGLRANKGNEKGYIAQSLQECRNEAKSQDMDVKTAATLKLIYLEMFGYSMNWASFHILEVMSSPKFVQKRVGYLAAVQSFRLDTDVLMLATNLLKKDLSAPNPFELSLAINGLSHVVSPSLARDLTTDLIAKMNHSNPYIRKKAVLVMYKIFLQWPEALRTSFPRLRERLEDTDTSVVSATVTVVCELARKNPRNYLPLAPQLFNLLTTSTNTWMVIKIIKLFATLAPLEPRLVKKLIPPITNIIKTTTSLSLLYECINGIISGGLLSQISGTREGEELATLCVQKLRGFLVEGDSNLKYVALLALTKLVQSHAYLVQNEKDVIMECIDDADVSIRLRVLELVVGMVDIDSLQNVVGRLMRQLRPITAEELEAIEKEANLDAEDPEEGLTARPRRPSVNMPLQLPADYKQHVINRILEMCSRDTYANVADFLWYIDVLVQLIRFCPAIDTKRKYETEEGGDADEEEEIFVKEADPGAEIGKELRNIAVRVKSVRREATEAAEMLVGQGVGMFPAVGGGGRAVLSTAGWIVGEYNDYLSNPNATLNSLILPISAEHPEEVLSVYLQSIPKVYACLTSNESVQWTEGRKSSVLSMTERIIKFLEPLTQSPGLEVQERAVEFLELFRLAREAINEQPAIKVHEDDDGQLVQEEYDPPLILTQVIPSLFIGMELNPVAQKAQRKVPVPADLDLDQAINPNLAMLLSQAELDVSNREEVDKDFEKFYYQKPTYVIETAAQRIDRAAAVAASSGGGGSSSGSPSMGPVGSYQSGDESYLDPDIIARRKADRRKRNEDDPFYIGSNNSGRASPMNPMSNESIDIDSIPIMKLDLGGGASGGGGGGTDSDSNMISGRRTPQHIPRVKVEIAGDEDGDDLGSDKSDAEVATTLKRGGKKKKRYPGGILGIDASNLASFSLEEMGAADESGDDRAKSEREKEEVRRAREEINKLRGEMERAAERVKAQQETQEVTAPKKKKKKKKEGDDGELKKKKKKGTKQKEENAGDDPKPKKKKKKEKKPAEDAAAAAVAE